jgi:hypothetical protein
MNNKRNYTKLKMREKGKRERERERERERGGVEPGLTESGDYGP